MRQSRLLFRKQYCWEAADASCVHGTAHDIQSMCNNGVYEYIGREMIQ